MKSLHRYVLGTATCAALVGACIAERDAPSGSRQSPATTSTGSGSSSSDTGGDVGAGGGDSGGGGAAMAGEDCFDGIDDDGDGNTDCDDPTCEAVCTSPCASPRQLLDPGTADGVTAGHATFDAASCAVQASAGHVFAITAKNTGVLEVYVASIDDDDDLAVSFQTTCGDPTTELACANDIVGHEPPSQEYAKADVSAGDRVYVVVQGHNANHQGAFTLYAETRVVECGDAHIDEGEECDDGNDDDSDGCTAACEFNPTEAEPNDAPEEGDVYDAPWFGAIQPHDDEDFVSFDVPDDNYGLVAAVYDMGDGGCALGKIDSFVELFDDAMESVAFDDDSGDGLCAYLVARDLTAGQHHLVVGGPEDAAPGQGFVYHLVIEGDVCGNGVIGGPETCDDGNVDGDDGCSQFCTLESP